MRKAQYTDLAATVADRIQNGDLPPGTRLPTHRAFAEEHGVALATATRAYKELKRQGFVAGEAGRGVFVRDLGLPLTLGLEQRASDGLIDMVFNMPGEAEDADMLRAALRRMAASGDLEAMLRYQPHGGRPHERRIIAAHAGDRLGHVDPERLLVTSGGQHGLALAVLGLLKRGDTVGTDPLTYAGFKTVAALHGLNLASVEGTSNGMHPDVLDRACREKKLSALYLMPTVQNPLGSVMDEETRRRIVDVARRHDLLIIEDSAYAFLETDPPPSLIELAPERTIHVGGFSKNIATGLRVGFLVAPPEHVDILAHVIRATTWNAPALITGIVTSWIEDGTLAQSEGNRRRNGAMRQALCHDILQGHPIVAHRNAGFAWLPLEAGRRTEPIITRLTEAGIAVSSANPYAVTEAVPQAIRLAFGGVSMTDLETALGIVRRELDTAPA